MRRRKFIVLVSGAAAWPLAARTQEGERTRRIGILSVLAADDPEGQARIAAFLRELQQLGWSEGRNLRVEYRWSTGNLDGIRRDAVELVALEPDVILAAGGQAMVPLREATRSVPIVFTQTPDPVGAGFVESLARPGSNTTGFTNFDYGASGKWLEVLKQIAPHLMRAGVLRDATIPAGTGQWGAIQAVAPSLGVDLSPIDVRDAREIERAVSEFARGPDRGLIVTTAALAIRNRDLIITLASQHRLPTIYPFRFYATSGGPISYGPDSIDPHRRAAGYVDRILKGEKPADLPVQAPTKYELVINLETAKALGITVPPSLLARADEVIE